MKNHYRLSWLFEVGMRYQPLCVCNQNICVCSCRLITCYTVRPEISSVLQLFDTDKAIPHYSPLYQPGSEDKKQHLSSVSITVTNSPSSRERNCTALPFTVFLTWYLCLCRVFFCFSAADFQSFRANGASNLKLWVLFIIKEPLSINSPLFLRL